MGLIDLETVNRFLSNLPRSWHNVMFTGAYVLLVTAADITIKALSHSQEDYPETRAKE